MYYFHSNKLNVLVVLYVLLWLICLSNHPITRMNHPDFVIRLDEAGRIAEILSTLPLTYVVVQSLPAGTKEVQRKVEQDFLGTYPEILKRLDMAEPSKEFIPWIMWNLCGKSPLLIKAIKKRGFDWTQYGRAYPYTIFQEGKINALKTLFNAFVKADKKLMDEYLKLQK